jgi:hypothetical protein
MPRTSFRPQLEVLEGRLALSTTATPVPPPPVAPAPAAPVQLPPGLVSTATYGGYAYCYTYTNSGWTVAAPGK